MDDHEPRLADARTTRLLVIGAVALLYLVTEKLLTEAHEAPERWWHTVVFLGGFIVVFLIESVG